MDHARLGITLGGAKGSRGLSGHFGFWARIGVELGEIDIKVHFVHLWRVDELGVEYLPNRMIVLGHVRGALRQVLRIDLPALGLGLADDVGDIQGS
ncbi:MULTISPECIES: hypothetical protein [Streptomyces]|uniref:Uncharacterized protein n=1 Tax=Streptomyces ehimensis TaxID=68195 RepID=A0ABV9BUP6_9ACTN